MRSPLPWIAATAIGLVSNVAIAQDAGLDGPGVADASIASDTVVDEEPSAGDEAPPETADDEALPPPPPPPLEDPGDPVEDTDEEPDRFPFDLTTSLVTRFEVREKHDQVNRADSDSFRFRARVGIVTDQLELSDDISVALRFVPQVTGVWQLAGLLDPVLGLHIGSLEVYGGPLRLETGRFEMSYGDELVIGTVGWHPVGRAFDGTRLRWSTGPEGAFVDAFFTVTQEGSPVTNFGSGDTYFTGFYAGLGPHLAEGVALDGYALLLVSPASSVTDPMTMLPVPVDPSGRVTLGARYKQRFGLIDARAEVGLQVGSQSSTRSVLAYQADAEVGVHLIDDRLRLSLEGLVASGDDPDDPGTNGAWAHLFPTAHKWLGFSDIIGFGGGINGAGRSNLTSGVLHVTVKVIDGFGVSAHGHIFARPQDVVLVDPMDPMMTTRVDAGYAGSELDFGANWTIAPGLATRAGYAIFLPNRSYYGTDVPAHFLELELKFTY